MIPTSTHRKSSSLFIFRPGLYCQRGVIYFIPPQAQAPQIRSERLEIYDSCFPCSLSPGHCSHRWLWGDSYQHTHARHQRTPPRASYQRKQHQSPTLTLETIRPRRGNKDGLVRIYLGACTCVIANYAINKSS